jgi:uncharacterized SAM-binding protein YcdF (DUF218 family)
MSDPSLKNYLPQLQQVWDALARQDAIPAHADAIVVGGCRDLGLAERTAELYHAGVSKFIVISGYKPQHLDITEAELLANRCFELGVPNKAIKLERLASNTGENILFSAEVIINQLQKAESVVLVHKPFMSLRFLATAEAQWPHPQPEFYTTCQSISFEDYCRERGLGNTAWEMLGDFKRMDEYVSKGYQTQQAIPSAALDAYQEIVRAGFLTR